MPKRVRDDEAAAALAEGDPPRSEHYPNDDGSWERAQDDWLQRWQPGTALPARGDKKRRTEWDKVTKKHNRHASKPGAEPDAAAPAPAPPAPAPPSAEETTLPAYSRSWELRALRAMCLGRNIEYSVSDTNEDLLTKLAAAAAPPPPPAAAPVERDDAPDAPVHVQSIAELRRQCRALGVEYSISESNAQLAEKLAAAGQAA